MWPIFVNKSSEFDLLELIQTSFLWNLSSESQSNGDCRIPFSSLLASVLWRIRGLLPPT